MIWTNHKSNHRNSNPNQIKGFQIKSFLFKSNHHVIKSWFKSNHDLILPITDRQWNTSHFLINHQHASMSSLSHFLACHHHAYRFLVYLRHSSNIVFILHMSCSLNIVLLLSYSVSWPPFLNKHLLTYLLTTYTIFTCQSITSPSSHHCTSIQLRDRITVSHTALIHIHMPAQRFNDPGKSVVVGCPLIFFI